MPPEAVTTPPVDLGARQREQRVQGASRLERAGHLEALELQDDVPRQRAAGRPPQLQQRRSADVRPDPLGRRLDLAEADLRRHRAVSQSRRNRQRSCTTSAPRELTALSAVPARRPGSRSRRLLAAIENIALPARRASAPPRRVSQIAVARIVTRSRSRVCQESPASAQVPIGNLGRGALQRHPDGQQQDGQVVELPEHRDEAGHRVDRRDRVGQAAAERRLAAPRDGRIVHQQPAELDVARHARDDADEPGHDLAAIQLAARAALASRRDDLTLDDAASWTSAPGAPWSRRFWRKYRGARRPGQPSGSRWECAHARRLSSCGGRLESW